MVPAVVEIQPMTLAQIRNFFSLKIDGDITQDLLYRQLHWLKTNYLFLNSLFTLPTEHYTPRITTIGNRPSSIQTAFHYILSTTKMNTEDHIFKDRFVRVAREFIDLFIASHPILVALEYRLQRALVNPNNIPEFPNTLDPIALGITHRDSVLLNQYTNIVIYNNTIIGQFGIVNGHMIYNNHIFPGRPSLEQFLAIVREINYGNYAEEFSGDCSICCEAITPIEKLSCGHRIHVDCVIKSRCTTCPMCRQEVALSTKELTDIYNLKYNV